MLNGSYFCQSLLRCSLFDIFIFTFINLLKKIFEICHTILYYKRIELKYFFYFLVKPQTQTDSEIDFYCHVIRNNRLLDVRTLLASRHVFYLLSSKHPKRHLRRLVWLILVFDLAKYRCGTCYCNTSRFTSLCF